MLRHLVLFAFKTSSSEQNIQNIEVAFVHLKHQIKEVTAFEWGLNVSPENHAQGFTHCFLLTFEDESDRDVYLKHPAHVSFGRQLEPHLEKVCVIDYWTEQNLHQLTQS